MNQPESGAVLGRYEHANLVLPLLFLALAAMEISVGIGLASGQGYFEANLISNLLFLNITHTALTIPMLMLLPEYKTFVREEYRGRPSYFWGKISAIFFLLFAFFLLFNAGLVSKLTGLDKRTAFVLLAALNFIPQTQHVIAQIFGISSIYARRTREPSGVLARDRLAFKAFVFFTSVLFFLLFFAGSRDHGLPPGLTLLKQAAWIGGGSTLLFIIFNNARSAPKKILYLSRLGLWLMVPLSVVAWAGVKAVHSMEYVFLCLDFSGQSKISGAQRRRYLWIAGIFTGGSLLVAYYVSRSHEQVLGLSAQDTKGDLLLRVLLSLSVATAILHYYLDRLIFRMRSPAVRKNIAPLLERR